MGAPDPLAPLREAPERTALILDVDGTLAPIAPRPELAAVPEPTRAALAALVPRYRLVACVSGRPGAQATAMVGVEGVRCVGNHGLELHPELPRLAAEIAAFREAVDGVWPVEDKGLSLSFHYREAEDEAAALAVLHEVARRAAASGLDPRWGRKVLEVRPRALADKGTAVIALLAESSAERALYAGDDTTDLDAFRGLRAAGLSHSVCVAVSSPEAPEELLTAADLVVTGPAGVTELLEALEAQSCNRAPLNRG